jgi:hypothetical protein
MVFTCADSGADGMAMLMWWMLRTQQDASQGSASCACMCVHITLHCTACRRRVPISYCVVF